MDEREADNIVKGQRPTRWVAVKDAGLTDVCRALFYFFVFLFAMEFLGKNYLWLYLGCAFYLVTARYVRFRAEVVPLLILSVCILIYSDDGVNVTSMLRAFAYPLCYFVGSNLYVEKDANKLSQKRQENALCGAIYAFALGAFVHLMLNLFYNIGGDGGRNTLDVWSGVTRSASNQAALGLLAVGVTVAFLFSRRKLVVKLLALCVLALVSWYALTLAGRTLFVILLLTAFVAFLRMWRKEGRNGRFYLIIFILLVLIGIFAVMVASNAFGLKTMIQGSNFYKRFFGSESSDLGETSRWGTKAYYLQHFHEHLYGGSHMFAEVGDYAHDIFLDTYDQNGLYALLAMVAFLCSAVYNFVLFMRSRKASFFTKQVVLCIHIVFAVEFCIEPILQGMTWMFSAFCMIQGAIANARYNEERGMLS